jgi:antitoxin HicB
MAKRKVVRAKRTVEDYLALPYHIEVVYDTSGAAPGWFARVLELPGCMTQAGSFEALGPMIQDAMRGWIEIGLEDGQPIPEPAPDAEFSGKFVLRVPRSLHRQLAEAAEREGVSLNTYIGVVCAKAVGTAEADWSTAGTSQVVARTKPAVERLFVARSRSRQG